MIDSIFTKIIKGEIPAHVLYEDERTIAFLDIHPLSRGHTLVVPKEQVEFLWDLDDGLYQAVMATAHKVALHLRGELAVPYVGMKVVGTDVPHAHVHLIPFDQEDEYHHQANTAEPDHELLSALAAMLKM